VDKNFINHLPVDSSPIFEDDQSLMVWIEESDGSGQEQRVRVDLRWVSISQAVDALRNTFLVDIMYDAVAGELDLITDVLVTRGQNGEIVFYVGRSDANDFTVYSHAGRTRA
jgi:hypothetical protein